MANYLNDNGLLYLWQKVKDKFATKESIPTKTSDLNNDSGFITIEQVPDTGVITFNGRGGVVVPQSGDYTAAMVGALPDTTSIPSKTSDIENDSNFITLSQVTPDGIGAIPATQIGSANGVCPLNSTSKIDSTYLPSYIDDVIEAYTIEGATALGVDWLTTVNGSKDALVPETGKIYVVLSAGDYMNMEFRWGGTTYIKISDSGLTPITNSEIDTIVAT